jgi:DNA-binding NarL/FixJ family response regulator
VIMVADEPSFFETVERMSPDLIIVDLSLPAAEGGNIFPRLRERFPAALVLVVSVHNEGVLARQLLEAGAAGVVLKHALATDLLPAIQQVLLGGKYVSPALERRIRINGLDPD